MIEDAWTASFRVREVPLCGDRDFRRRAVQKSTPSPHKPIPPDLSEMIPMALAKWILKHFARLWWSLIAWPFLLWIFKNRDYLWFALMASAEERKLFALINDARTHPEKYPPRGNTTGAAMTACPRGFKVSSALTKIARAHNSFLKDQSKAWVVTGNNMHLGPNGKDVTDDGEPMHKAGFIAYRGENQAVGYGAPEQVMTFWMQEDEAHGWGHRNAILNCNHLEAGVGHYKGGPWGHY